MPITTIVVAIDDSPLLANLKAAMVEDGRREMEHHWAAGPYRPVPKQPLQLMAANQNSWQPK